MCTTLLEQPSGSTHTKTVMFHNQPVHDTSVWPAYYGNEPNCLYQSSNNRHHHNKPVTFREAWHVRVCQVVVLPLSSLDNLVRFEVIFF